MRVSSIARYVVRVVLLAAALTALGRGAVYLQPSQGISLIYPATGLGAAILWGFGFRWWPVVILAQFALSFSVNGFVWIPFFVAANELMVTALFVWTMRRFAVSPDLARLRDLGIFTLGALLTTAAGGVTTFISEYLFVDRATNLIVGDAISIWLSDFVSIIIFVPLVLCWRRWPFATKAQFSRWLALTMFLIVLGAYLILKPWFEEKRLFGKAEQS